MNIRKQKYLLHWYVLVILFVFVGGGGWGEEVRLRQPDLIVRIMKSAQTACKEELVDTDLPNSITLHVTVCVPVKNPSTARDGSG